jgi:hypothetical protein
MNRENSRVLAFSPVARNSTAALAARHAEPPEVDRRAYARYQYTAEAKVIERLSEAELSGRCSDISLGGCYIDALSPFPVGAGVRVALTTDAGNFSADGIVASSTDGMGMGLRFTSIEPDQRRILNGWIRDLSGSEPEEISSTAARFATEQAKARDELPYVLNELILFLLRKGILPEEQGRDMLRRLLG